MSLLGKVEMSPKIVPRATGDEDVEDCNEHHDEHAGGRSSQDGASRDRQDAAVPQQAPARLPSGSVTRRKWLPVMLGMP